MTLDSQAQALLDKAKAAGASPVYFLPVLQARARMEELFKNPDPPEDMYSVKEVVIPGPMRGLALRMYRPVEETGLGCLIFIHGGGWTVNSINTHDAVCRRLSKLGNCIVLSVDHRMSPEFKYPAALEDTYTALQWAFDNGSQHGWDATRVAIGGDSTGGTLATTAALLNRDRGGLQLKYQILIYPVTDYYLPGTVSYVENATGYSLNRDFMIWFWQNYLPVNVDFNDPYLCPLRAADLSDLPPALILTAEYDPLRDEGREYANRLRSAGVPVELWHYDNQMHGFIMQTRAIDRAREALEKVGHTLRDVLGRS
jgi:acetyl esterase/lipase